MNFLEITYHHCTYKTCFWPITKCSETLGINGLNIGPIICQQEHVQFYLILKASRTFLMIDILSLYSNLLELIFIQDIE